MVEVKRDMAEVKRSLSSAFDDAANAMPSLGFLHSLQRVLPALERALAAVGDGAASAAVDEQD